MGGLIFSDFDWTVHTFDFEVSDEWPRFLLTDSGVVQVWATSPDGVLYLLREYKDPDSE